MATANLTRAWTPGAAGGPAATGRLALLGGVAVNLVIIEILYWTSDLDKNALVWIGRFLGLHLAFTMALQLVLVARLPWLDRRIGMDRLTSWHRLTGFTVFWLALLHPTFILLGYARYDGVPVLRTVAALSKQMPVILGLIAVGLIVAVAATSIRAARRRLSYESWHTVHFLLYAVLTFAIIHQVYEGSSFTTSAVARIYWWGLWAGAIAALLAGRFVVPLRRNARHQFRVAAVVPESDDVVSVHITGRHLDELPASAGQFFIWRFLGHNRWWQANPFSLSAAPDGRSLRLTAKASGTTSAGLRNLPVGTRVFAEGPYGAFTGLHRVKESTLLIAGGVGVTPVRSLLEELTGPVIVLYRVRSMADAVLLEEMRQLAAMRGAQVHVLTGRTADGDPLDAHSLRTLVPDITDRDVFVCGPPRMTEAVVRTLRGLGVPAPQIHDERFSLAS